MNLGFRVKSTGMHRLLTLLQRSPQQLKTVSLPADHVDDDEEEGAHHDEVGDYSLALPRPTLRLRRRGEGVFPVRLEGVPRLRLQGTD